MNIDELNYISNINTKEDCHYLESVLVYRNQNIEIQDEAARKTIDKLLDIIGILSETIVSISSKYQALETQVNNLSDILHDDIDSRYKYYSEENS